MFNRLIRYQGTSWRNNRAASWAFYEERRESCRIDESAKSMICSLIIQSRVAE